MTSNQRFARLGAALAVLSIFAGCGEKNQAGPGAGMPPPEVAVVTVAPQRLTISNELPGRLEATRVAQVRARVAGIVQKREFREGSDVKAGELLFRIDPATYQASLESAQAALARAEANLVQASLKLQRYQPLVEINAVSKQEYDDANAAQKQAAADVASAKAARTTASLNLGYASVTAPISGRIGRALVTEGALVGQGEATQLATIQQLDPIYVNLTQSSTDLLQLQRALASGQLQGVGKGKAAVTLVLEDGTPYPLPGKLLFSDLAVDESTGAVSLRAEFPNPQRSLLPGMYVRARLEQAVQEQAISVPQQAVTRSADSASVMVVGADGKVAARTVKTSSAQGTAWLISEGLQAGDRVVVEGLQKIKPGAVVKVVPWQPKAPDTGKVAPPSPQQNGSKKKDTPVVAPAASAAKAQ
ncbi:efflux RND transporter periplasmic adaptor subunit [Herminiimonas sp. CN]|uniref:efflux RND transporter periplasmic adaptor subunit n=1 Tax=Herminiimonas sp. CN TaxID=1349818 RepID=UPI000473D2D5|nr:efflux RND transporter periplasmic adaptor subunit [Herminiimonas sp. CN]